MLQPTVRRTWAPRGETPVLKSWDRHDRLSVTSAITLSPIQHRLALFWRVQSENVRGPDVASFLRGLRRASGRRLLVILDRLGAHRTAARLLDADVSDSSSERARIASSGFPATRPS